VTKKAFPEVAAEFRALFDATLAKRVDMWGREYDQAVWQFVDNAPVWATDFVFRLHDGKLPDDEIFAHVVSALDTIKEMDPTTSYSEHREVVWDWAEETTPQHVGELVRWLGEYPGERVELMDRARAEHELESAEAMMYHAYFAEAYNRFDRILSFCIECAAKGRDDDA
jgi:hypothetical protein